TPGTVVARMIDGLGFRYYWATQGLTEENLLYKPAAESRNIAETVDHIYNLSKVIYNSAKKEVNDRTAPREADLSFKEKRAATLNNLSMSSKIFMQTKDLGEHKVIFKNNSGSVEFPFWNQINGPIEDAVWHTGQVVLMRRAAGNPFDSNVSVLRGIRREN
ncbi:MAG: DinB family protein, partial [Flavobacteriaceae bacterium]